MFTMVTANIFALLGMLIMGIIVKYIIEFIDFKKFAKNFYNKDIKFIKFTIELIKSKFNKNNKDI